MTTTSKIERIVREVLAEMAHASAPARFREGEAPAEPKDRPGLLPAPSARQEPRPPEASRPSVNHQELSLASRLVTMNEIAGRLPGVRRLVVRKGTVITPAVKEELSKRNIQVIFGTPAADKANGSLKLAIVAARTKIDSQPLAAALQSDGVEIDLHSSKCVIEATDRLAGEVQKPATLGLLLTPHEAESLCLANRLPGVRAIAGKEAAQVAADASAVGANVLVINPKKTGPFALRQMLGEFCRSGARPCPEVLKPRLG
jgi:hypothetical protein